MQGFKAFVLPIQSNLLDAALLIQNIAEKENINADVVYLKTETKPFTQNAYLIFYRDIYHVALTSRTREYAWVSFVCFSIPIPNQYF